MATGSDIEERDNNVDDSLSVVEASVASAIVVHLSQIPPRPPPLNSTDTATADSSSSQPAAVLPFDITEGATNALMGIITIRALSVEQITLEVAQILQAQRKDERKIMARQRKIGDGLESSCLYSQ